MANKIGILTIGQSPRIDMTPEMQTMFPDDVEVVEMGALDGLNDDELKDLAPHDGDVTLISRLANGSSVTVSEEAILPLLQEKITLLEEAGVRTTILACTGSFPPFDSQYPLLFPDALVCHFVAGVLPKGKLGVIVPLPEQAEHMQRKWKRDGLDLAFAAASPYHADTDFEQAATVLTAENVDMIVLDCMGYNAEMKNRVKNVADVPVVLSRGVVARVAAELV